MQVSEQPWSSSVRSAAAAVSVFVYPSTFYISTQSNVARGNTGVARGRGLRGLGPQRMRKKYQSYTVNLPLNVRYKNDKKNTKFVITRFVFQAQNAPIFGRGSAPDPARGAYDAPHPIPIPLPARRLRRLELSAYVASVLRPPQHKILAAPVRGNVMFLCRSSVRPFVRPWHCSHDILSNNWRIFTGLTTTIHYGTEMSGLNVGVRRSRVRVVVE